MQLFQNAIMQIFNWHDLVNKKQKKKKQKKKKKKKKKKTAMTTREVTFVSVYYVGMPIRATAEAEGEVMAM